MPILNDKNTVIIACSMIKNEIVRVMEENNLTYPVVWLEKGLHEYPEKLRKELEHQIPLYDHYEYMILLYGLCGNAVVGLQTQHAVLVIPNFDDCVRMLMCCEQGQLIPTHADRLYLTGEWTTSEKFLLKEFDAYKEKYGEKKGLMIAKMMMGHYSGIDMIDDGTYDAPACADSIREKAAQYDLECGCVRGTLRVIEKILLGHWDEEVVIKKPGDVVVMSDFDRRTRCI